MPIIKDDPFGSIKDIKKPGQTVEPKLVNSFHAKSDVDSSTESQHHTIGIKANQAAPGDHIHDGRSSKRLLEGVTLAADTTTATWRNNVDQALQRLGATKL